MWSSSKHAFILQNKFTKKTTTVQRTVDYRLIEHLKICLHNSKATTVAEHCQNLLCSLSNGDCLYIGVEVLQLAIREHHVRECCIVVLLCHCSYSFKSRDALISMQARSNNTSVFINIWFASYIRLIVKYLCRYLLNRHNYVKEIFALIKLT